MAVLLEDAVALVRGEIVEKGKRVLAFQAPPGFGKSAVLAGLAASLVAMGRPVLHVSFPTGDDAALEQRLVRHLLSPGHDATFTLPPAIADVIRAQIGAGDPAWLPDEPAGDAHREAANYHRARYARYREHGDIARAIKEELEEIHQLTEAGDAGALLGRSLQFVEQYDALGRSLSRRALREDRPEAERLRLDAVRAYERALAHDPDDAYAHHYLAYNLDILGMNPDRVNEEFLAARDLDPKHPWYHGRYICFLITRSRMEQARAAWERALVDLDYAAGPRRRVYEELHGPVARHLLSHAQLAFASEVLDDVPREQRDERWWRALSRLCVHLEEDRDERLVFPLGVALEERWNGPHLLVEDPEGPRVVRWRPGRVVATEDGAVILHISEQPPPAPEWIRTLRLTAQALRERWRWSARTPSPGTFVELIEYEDGGAELKSWDRDASRFVPAHIVALGGTTHITGLPRRHEEQSGRAEARSLAELADHDDIVFATTTTGFPDCYVLVSIPPGGEPCTVTCGPGSVAVTR